MDYFLGWCVTCEKRISPEYLYCSQECQFADFVIDESSASQRLANTSPLLSVPSQMRTSSGSSIMSSTSSSNGHKSAAALLPAPTACGESLENWVISMDSSTILDSIDCRNTMVHTASIASTITANQSNKPAPLNTGNNIYKKRHSLTQFASLPAHTDSTLNHVILQSGHSPYSSGSSNSSIVSSSSLDAFPKLLRRGHRHRQRTAPTSCCTTAPPPTVTASTDTRSAATYCKSSTMRSRNSGAANLQPPSRAQQTSGVNPGIGNPYLPSVLEMTAR
ncbi:expressed protein [Batrachochytrium dendrobatidis JAM81]|uniref:Expressed protein n=2 Tax=Batrachochytrium dendrobatidis TaxID=109871 RepID=F4NX95_BATDJ|nr:uncharacterized protein BATDEDRAFT_34353 [Batrachochytrium dendrobatidis JAM81]EGF82321.1 expressed protein [Batrachochytrium dendrobatidis JAM81]KAJ8328452.1 hypothetical protein O5D80_003804 [Batrachochytrium dendrobatidis]KAK5666987.1 hypothetical protein QVD99_006208 [Batrachochytrium dendrobatidis]OAJ39982.1 hypothetical protein BDEG_23769 [Batrachochytrium dendrobatidis JEL423]|eukprot:XP_006676768.1 expressed protein [Batrachochytrium dendrobatidis JAM81]